MESMVESMVESISLSWTPLFEGGLYAVVTLETTCSSAKTLGREDRYPAKLSHTRSRSSSVAGSEADRVTACCIGAGNGGARGGVCDGKDGGTELACTAGCRSEFAMAEPGDLAGRLVAGPELAVEEAASQRLPAWQE